MFKFFEKIDIPLIYFNPKFLKKIFRKILGNSDLFVYL